MDDTPLKYQPLTSSSKVRITVRENIYNMKKPRLALPLESIFCQKQLNYHFWSAANMLCKMPSTSGLITMPSVVIV